MTERKLCLRCGHDMTGYAWNVCPQCGNWFAVYTKAQRRMLFAGGIAVGVVVNAVIVVLLWRFA